LAFNRLPIVKREVEDATPGRGKKYKGRWSSLYLGQKSLRVVVRDMGIKKLGCMGNWILPLAACQIDNKMIEWYLCMGPPLGGCPKGQTKSEAQQ
jgi:hypothetical protein